MRIKVIICFLFLFSNMIFASDSDRLFDSAWNLIKENKHDAALNMLQQIIRTDKNYGLAYRDIGWLLYDKRDNPKEALRYLETAEKLIPDDVYVPLYLGLTHYKLGNYRKSISFYEQSIHSFEKRSLDPPKWIYNGIAEIYLFKLDPPDYSRGIEYSSLSLKNNSAPEQNINSYRFISYGYYRQNRLDSSLEFARRAGRDFWITKWLSPRTITLDLSFKLKTIRDRYFPHLGPSLIKIHMPMDTYYQKFVSLESTPPHIRIIKEGRENLAVFDFSGGYPETLKLRITVTNQVLNREPENVRAFTRAEDETGYFANTRKTGDLYFPIEYDIENPALRKTVSEITKNDTTEKEKVLSIYNWISKNIVHDMNTKKFRDKSLEYLKISEVMNEGHGYCTQISSLFIGMCRILQVPARIISGLQTEPNIDKTSGSIIAHDTVELYDSSRKEWVYLEPQGYNGYGVNFWGHVVFHTEQMNPRRDTIDIMRLWGITRNELKMKDQMTYEVRQP